MKSILLSRQGHEQGDWESFIASFFKNKFKLPLNEPVMLWNTDSISGLECIYQKNGLKILAADLPSMKDWHLFNSLLQSALKENMSLTDEKSKIINKAFDEDELPALHSELFDKALEAEKVIVSRDLRKADISPLLESLSGKSQGDIENTICQKLRLLQTAATPDVFDVDGLQTAIWGKESLWLDKSLQQLLFSQAVFKERLCGSIGIADLKIALQGTIWDTSYGILLPAGGTLSTADFHALTTHMNHFEVKAKEEKKQVKLEIKVGDLDRIAYEIAGVLFKNSSMKQVNGLLVKEGFSEDQLEVAALAVSRLFEVAATQKGVGLKGMAEALMKSHKLTPEAANAVVMGFVRAAQEAKLKPRLGRGFWVLVGIVVVIGLLFLPLCLGIILSNFI